MQVERLGDDFVVTAQAYRLCVDSSRIEVLGQDERYFVLSPRSSVNQPGQTDVDISVANLECVSTASTCVFTWVTRSNIWERKEYILECSESDFLYRVKVYGSGRVADLNYFSGGDQEGPAGSEYEAAQYMCPVALGGGTDNRYFTTAQQSSIELGYLCPPMFCYPFRLEKDAPWMGLGLVAKSGQYNFDRFSYQPIVRDFKPRFLLQTDFLGYTQVHRSWESPSILGVAGANEMDVLLNYSQWHYSNQYCKVRGSGSVDWWRGPLFCGWGEQCAVNSSDAQSAATQEEYSKMSRRLDELGLRPAVLIIDDKWQRFYGEALPDTAKWPNLREFVDLEHAKNRKVVLWFKAWNSEGIPADECVTLWGQPYGVDPTNPKYQARLRATLYKLLSGDTDCCDCDGFKIDFANVMPLGRDLAVFETGVYGIELLKRLFALIYETAKDIKPEALINCSCCHPYFAEVTDQARLHDYYWGMRSAKSVMKYRAALFQSAMPGVSIDTDGVVSTHRETMEYMKFAPELGVPDLYTLSGGPDVQFTDEDWQTIRTIWEDYSKGLRRDA